MNEIQPILEHLIGVYTPRVYTDGSPLYGLASLDIPYLCRFAILTISLIFIFALFTKLIVRLFGVIK